MKRAILILVAFLIAGCSPTLKSSSGIPIKAIYLVQGTGQLSQEDLQAHSEVMVTNNFDEFKKLAKSKVALWIDINAVGLVEMGWLNREPQKSYPLVLLGVSNALCAFRDTLDVDAIFGPQADCSAPPPGFSIWMIEIETDTRRLAFMNGYEQAPATQDILAKTNLLLEGKEPLLESK